MIILDAETSGLDEEKNSVLSLGAVFQPLYGGGHDEFYGECHIREGTEIDDYSLAVNGFTREQCLDFTRPSPEKLYRDFLAWVLEKYPVHTRPIDPKTNKPKAILLGGQQVGSFDIRFIKFLHDLYVKDIDWPFGHRSVDLHSVAFEVFKESLSLDGILEKLGYSPEAKPHHALTGARLEALAFRCLLRG